MHSTLIALAFQAFSPAAPTCSPATAAHVDALAHADVRAPATLAAAVALADTTDGAACLMQTWLVPKLYFAHERPELLTRLLVDALDADRVTAQHAARVVRIIGVASPEAFKGIVAHYRLGARGLTRLATDVAAMPVGPKRVALTESIEARAEHARSSP